MNEEEKKAIEYMEQYIDEINSVFGGAITSERAKNYEIILNLIEKLQKENEEYSKQMDLDYVYENYIPKQKIKRKIEELSQYYKKEIYPSLYQWSDITITEHYDEMIALLQELLEEEEKEL